MAIRQISIFVDNKPGILGKVTQFLADNNIDLRALSIADAADFGVVRFITSDVERAQEILNKEEYLSKVNHVLAVSVDDTPGGLSKLATLLGENGINIEYLYAFVLPSKTKACVVLRVESNKRAEEVLLANNVHLLSEEEILGA